jgi:hypothetical protein
MISISEATGSPRGSTLTAGSGLEPYPRGYPQADCRPGAGSAGTQPAGTGGALHGRARILCLRGLGLSAAESARSYHQPGLYRHQSGRGVQGQDHGTQAFPVGDELRRLPGEDEVAPGLITPTPDRLCRGRAIEDAIQLHCVELARTIFEVMFGRNLHWKEWAAPRSVAPARSSNQDASLQQLQDRFRMQTVLRRPRSPLEMSLRGRLSGVRLALDFGIQFGPEKHDDH